MRKLYFIIILFLTFFMYSKTALANKYSCEGVYQASVIDQSGVKTETKICPFNIVITDDDKANVIYDGKTVTSITCANKAFYFYNENVDPSYPDFDTFSKYFVEKSKNNKGYYSSCPQLSFSNIMGNYYVVVKGVSDSYFSEDPTGGEDPNTEYEYKNEFVLCSDKNALTVFKVLGLIILIAKILVPIILIVTGIIGLSQAIIKSDNDSLKKEMITLGKKTVIGIAIFLIPTFVNFVFGLVKNVGKVVNEFSDCMTCLTGSVSSCNSIIDEIKDKDNKDN